MSLLNNHSHFALLAHYLKSNEKLNWVLATIVNKEGSSYRSPGAIMLVNDLGQSYGLVSGGCLEANIVLHAKKVFESQQANYVEYDMREEDGYAAELGVGCKGKIGVLLQFLTPKHQVILANVYQRMHDGQASYLAHTYLTEPSEKHLLSDLSAYNDKGKLIATTSQQQLNLTDDAFSGVTTNERTHWVCSLAKTSCSITKISAPINLWVFGGGSDAAPLVSMAAQMGWRVTIVDHRSSYARSSSFKHAENILKVHPKDFVQFELFSQIDAAVLMTHNLNLDAAWLTLLHEKNVGQFIGLLGPLERRGNVENLSNITDENWLSQRVNGPVGLDIGGDLPESIALSILAQCHSVLHNRNGAPLSGKFINS